MHYVTLSPGEEAMLRAVRMRSDAGGYQGRPEQAVYRDERFLEAWIKARTCLANPKDTLTVVRHIGGKLTILTDEGDPKEYTLARGLYYKQDILAALKQDKKPAKLDQSIQFISLKQQPSKNGSLIGLLPGQGGRLVQIQNTGSKKASHVISPGWGGFVWQLHKSGKLTRLRNLSTSDFNENYPWLGAGTWQGYYYTAVFAQDIADRFDKAPEVLEDFRARLKLFPTATLNAVVPVWIRTMGWAQGHNGNRDTGASKEECGIIYEVRMPYMHNVMLRDEFAWRVHLSLDGEPLPGVAYFTDDAKLVISDWCFRETPDGKGALEMYHGKRNQLDILAWVAGPCADRFLGNAGQEYKIDESNPKVKTAHRLVPITPHITEKEKLKRIALLKDLLKTAGKKVNTLDELKALGPGMLVPDRYPWAVYWSRHISGTAGYIMMKYRGLVNLDAQQIDPATEDNTVYTWVPATWLPESVAHITFAGIGRDE